MEKEATGRATQPETAGTRVPVYTRTAAAGRASQATSLAGGTEAVRVWGCWLEEEARNNAASNVIY